MSGTVELRLSLPFDRYLSIGGSGEIFAVGARLQMENGRLNVGLSKVVGVSGTFGIGRRATMGF